MAEMQESQRSQAAMSELGPFPDFGAGAEDVSFIPKNGRRRRSGAGPKNANKRHKTVSVYFPWRSECSTNSFPVSGSLQVGNWSSGGHTKVGDSEPLHTPFVRLAVQTSIQRGAPNTTIHSPW